MPWTLDTLAALCDGTPLALRIATARLVSLEHWSLAFLLVRLRDTNRRLAMLAEGDLRLAAAIELSYQQPSAPAKKVDATAKPPDAPLESPYDVVIATVGGDALTRAHGFARGRCIITLPAPPTSQAAAAAHDVAATFFVVSPDGAALRTLTTFIDSGAITVHVGSTYALADGRAAFESGEAADRPPGKTVLVVRP